MANKRFDQFTSGTPTGDRIILHADPSTGEVKKAAISELPSGGGGMDADATLTADRILEGGNTYSMQFTDLAWMEFTARTTPGGPFSDIYGDDTMANMVWRDNTTGDFAQLDITENPRVGIAAGGADGGTWFFLSPDHIEIYRTGGGPLAVKLIGLPTYANEAAAVTGGLPTNTVYKTSTGELRIKL